MSLDDHKAALAEAEARLAKVPALVEALERIAGFAGEAAGLQYVASEALATWDDE